MIVCPASVSSENNTLPEQQRSPQLSWKQGHFKSVSLQWTTPMSKAHNITTFRTSMK